MVNTQLAITLTPPQEKAGRNVIPSPEHWPIPRRDEPACRQAAGRESAGQPVLLPEFVLDKSVWNMAIGNSPSSPSNPVFQSYLPKRSSNVRTST
jgi:hypothetical protein